MLLMKQLVLCTAKVAVCKHVSTQYSVRTFQKTGFTDSDDNQALSFPLLCTMEEREKSRQALAVPVVRI